MTLDAFFVGDDETTQEEIWGSKVEKERRLRIRLAVAAYAYEKRNDSIMSDSEFDKLCTQVDLSVDTGNTKLDSWFKKNFDPSTGQWIHKHPDLLKIRYLYENHYKGK